MTGRGVVQWPSGASYDGDICGGFIDGTGTFKGVDGSLYKGSWRMNKKHGMGTMVYANSDTYEGFWNEGLPEGFGKYTWANGNTYIGSWKSGKMNGRGVMKWTNGDTLDCNWLNGLAHGKVFANMHQEHVTSVHGTGDSRMAMEHTWQKQAGGPMETIYKGHRSYYLMLNLQLGIRYTVGKITPVPLREVRSIVFGPRAQIRMYFPCEGSQYTPPHCSVNFFWKDYCPMVFRNLREMFHIDAADYMMSVCGDDSLKELSSPGKSGSIFYLSQDERFVIKTLRKTELKILLKMLPKYYNHVRAYDNTLITNFFGVHRITLKGGRKVHNQVLVALFMYSMYAYVNIIYGSVQVRFVVMGNMFCTELRIHRKYDLKGSTQGRSTKKQNINENTTLKILDLSYVFHVDKPWRDALFRQISLDCMFLESQSIIDYSMLLGIHFRAPYHLKTSSSHQNSLETGISDTDLLQYGEKSSWKGFLLVAHEPGTTVGGSHIRGSMVRASEAGYEEVDLVLTGTGRFRVQLGVSMPARALKVREDMNTELENPDSIEEYDVVLPWCRLSNNRQTSVRQENPQIDCTVHNLLREHVSIG
ncbi:phosphatidylinositol 4-phosphate 5-kinase 1-like [Panicum miliaceum]|uniref:1-phosphatidylinositol-4-phosphate 5-kinase n=1 Tax=Panicum miliaceum TaxID=4540 RepID=A0A3L6SFU0_PANMI|nr:phosphatidylinositol 4-phosphate 5-kinase 1-like [Panicum miliaceum]